MTRVLDNALTVTENPRARHPRSEPHARFGSMFINTRRISSWRERLPALVPGVTDGHGVSPLREP